MLQNVDCEHHRKYCSSKSGLIDFVRKLADDDANHLKREHCDYLVSVIERDYHLLNHDEL